MKIMIFIFLILFFVSANAKQSTESFRSHIINYGSGQLQNLNLKLQYNSSSGHDGTCSNCFHKTYSLKIESDGTIQFPTIDLDPRNHQHSFTLKVENPIDRWGTNVLYFCDVLDVKFVACQSVLKKDLQVISAYSYLNKPLSIQFTSGLGLDEWLNLYKGMYIRVHVSLNQITYGEHLSWSNQIFVNCNLTKCDLLDGSLLFVGKDFGPYPPIYYSITATQDPAYSKAIKGIDEKVFSEQWSGDLPVEMSHFLVEDKQ